MSPSEVGDGVRGTRGGQGQLTLGLKGEGLGPSRGAGWRRPPQKWALILTWGPRAGESHTQASCLQGLGPGAGVGWGAG